MAPIRAPLKRSRSVVSHSLLNRDCGCHVVWTLSNTPRKVRDMSNPTSNVPTEREPTVAEMILYHVLHMNENTGFHVSGSPNSNGMMITFRDQRANWQASFDLDESLTQWVCDLGRPGDTRTRYSLAPENLHQAVDLARYDLLASRIAQRYTTIVYTWNTEDGADQRLMASQAIVHTTGVLNNALSAVINAHTEALARAARQPTATHQANGPGSEDDPGKDASRRSGGRNSSQTSSRRPR